MTQKTLLILAAAALACASCKNSKDEAPQKTPVEAIALKDTTCTMEYSYPANLEGIRDVDVYPQVSGQIVAINVIEGQKVKKGDLLFKLDDVTYKTAYDAALAEVEVAKTKVTTAEITLQSKQNLFDKGIISQYQLSLAKNELDVAKAELGQSQARAKSAKKDLSFTEVRSGVNGYVGSLPYKAGSVVNPIMPKPMTTVSDNSQIKAMFSVPENTYLEMKSEYDNLSNMEDLTLITNLGTKYAYPGKVRSASGMISSATGALPMMAVFPNPDGLLLSGGSGRVVFTTKPHKVIAVPRTSIKEIQNKTFVFVIKDGKLKQTEVKAMRLDKKNWALLPDEDGKVPVAAGDSITTSTNRLSDGLEVTTVSKNAQ